jgi:hypothetical protein
VAATAETCDRHPSARAAHVSSRDGLILTWCNHCITIRVDALVDDGWLIFLLDDQTRL